MRNAFAWVLVWLLFNAVAISSASAQDGSSVPVDTIPKRVFKRLDIFPAISYAPETKLTLGVIGIKYFDLSKGDLSTPISNLEFLGVYTLNKQIVFETRWEVFTRQRQWRTRGEAFFNRYPDRNYGIGNDAAVLVLKQNDNGGQDTVNYMFYTSDRIKVSPVVLRKIRPNLYAGVQYDMEYLFNMKTHTDEYFYVQADSVNIQRLPVAGVRSGIGFQVLYDNRERVINPLKGTVIELNNLNYGKFVGSDYRFTLLSVDARHYINTFKNQTLALRAVGMLEFTDDQIPMRALGRVGGHKFIRGYFKGTYQDKNMLAFETEYRLPFWPEGTKAKLWQVWKRLGIVGFVSGAQVFHEASDVRLDGFNLAVGCGLRVLFNPQSRVNLRFDYAFGLRNDSDGPGKRQRGFYFFLGEAF